MRILLLGSVALAALIAVGSAQAADLPARPAPVYKAPAMVPPPFSWTGFYIGVDGGYTWNRVGVFDPATPGAGTATANPNTGTFGAHAGFLYQFNNPVVIGLEGDWMYLDGNANGGFPGAPTQGIIASNKWDASVRGIAGVAFNQWLLYGTGGASWINESGCGVAVFPTNIVCAANTNFSDTRTGWVAGGGVSYAFTNNLIGRIEYLHADYGNYNESGTGWTGGTVNVTNKTDTVRAGLSWKFGMP